MNFPLEKLVVVGGGIIAWWAAVFIKKNNPNLDVTLLHDRVSEGYAESSESDFLYLLKLIGLSAQDLLQYADGNFYCAQAYFDWSRDTENYFHSNYVSDLDYDVVPYSQWLGKLKLAGMPINIDEYLLASTAARLGQVTLSEQHKILSAGISFDTTRFAGLLSSYAQRLNINVLNDEVKRVNLTENGAIESVLTVDESVITGDFFVDVTGRDAKLLGCKLQVGYESWAQYLPCDRKKILKSKPKSERLIPFTAAQLRAVGWVKNIPLQSQLIAEFVFNATTLAATDGQDATSQLFFESETHIFSPGMRKKTWYKNCLAIGPAGVTFDNFSHSSLYIAAVTLKRFVEFWPSCPEAGLVENEFNRLMEIEFHAIRDFHCVHYVLAKKSDTPFSRLLQEIELPDSLRYRMELFSASGRALADESTLVHASQWDNIFLGFGFWPKTADCMLANVTVNELELWSNTIKIKLQKNIANSPDYTRYMAKLISAR
jgi:tryptophan halogenase